MKHAFLMCAAAAVLAGCAAPTTRPTVGTATEVDAEVKYQRELALQQSIESNIRLYETAGRLRMGAAELCEKNVTPYLGVYAAQAADNDDGEIFKRLYKFDDRLAILHLASNSPAKNAGLQVNDVIKSIDGVPTFNLKQYQQAVESLKIGRPAQVEIIRGAAPQQISVIPIAACKYPATMTGSRDLNAYADGEKVILTQGMMNFAQTDEELALVVSHEIAHNMMRHLDARKTNAMGGFLVDLALAIASRGAYRDAAVSNLAASAYSQEFESEADYVGLYIMARSGYKIDDAPKFWRRMAVAHPANIKTNHTASHPSTAARMVALDSAVAEIKGKQAAKQALVPNKKDKSQTAKVESE